VLLETPDATHDADNTAEGQTMTLKRLGDISLILIFFSIGCYVLYNLYLR
jgi:hypothetical protein